MKLQILKHEGQEKITGYESVVVEPNKIDLSNVTDNEAEQILAADCVDMFSAQNIGALLTALRSKLRLGGSLVVGGTSIDLFAKSVVNGLLTPEDASGAVDMASSFSSPEMVSNSLTDLGLQIQSVITNGIHYEISCLRVQ